MELFDEKTSNLKVSAALNSCPDDFDLKNIKVSAALNLCPSNSE